MLRRHVGKLAGELEGEGTAVPAATSAAAGREGGEESRQGEDGGGGWRGKGRKRQSRHGESRLDEGCAGS